ncbi:MAG: hypothetical protein JNJ54_15695 [Myxococcaceae bacterium]|nr:hypothetical protein [Myxococcaceae bacterium]
MADTTVGWRRLVFGSAAPRFALVLGALVALPFCFTGFFADDFLHQALLRGLPGFAAGDRWNLFTFVNGDPAVARPLIENGPFPWWTLPTLKFSFLRPLTALIANVEHGLVGGNAVLLHLHSIAWYVALIAVANPVLARALRTSTAAPLAMILFAIDDAHAVVAGWIANRNALVSAVFALLALLAHLRWREERWWWGLPLSMGAAALGLAGGESAVGALLTIGAWEVTLGPGGWRRRLLALAPMTLVGVTYLVVYKLTGSGAAGSEIYNDPLAEPFAFLTRAPPKALALAGAQFLGTTADLWLIKVALRPALVAAGVVALAAVSWLLRALWPDFTDDERRALRWLGAAFGASLAPVLATFPLNRLLLVPSVFASAIIALVLVHGWRAPGRAVRWATRALVVPAVAQCAVMWPVNAGVYGVGSSLQRSMAMETALGDEALAGHVLVFAAPDPSAVLYTSMIRQLHGKPAAKSWVTVSFASSAHRLTRRSEREVEVEVTDGQMLQSVFEQLVRSSDVPVPIGYRVKLARATIEVTSLDGEARPKTLLVTLDQLPDGATFTLARWDDGVLGPLELPAVGESLVLPRATGLLSL